MPDLRLEDELLINCLKFHFDSCEDTRAIIKSISSRNIDWNRFVLIASLNRVIPMTWSTLKSEAYENVPKNTAIELQKICDEKQTRSIFNLNRLNELLVLFRENNIKMIPFKGPNFNRLYDHYTLRQSSDLDIVIEKKDINNVIGLLKTNGYKFRDELGADDFKKILDTRHSLAMIDNEEISEIDIHWRLEDSFEGIGIRFPIEELWREYTLQPVLNFQIPILNPKALILSTCIHHGLRNSWSQLKSICDIAVIINSHKNLKWEEIILDAKKLKIKRILLTGVSLTNRLFDLPLSHSLQQAIVKDKALRKIEELIIYTRLFKKRSSHELYASNTFIRYYMKDNFYAKLHFMSRVPLIKLKPNREDKKLIHLSINMLLIYYLVRRFCIVKKYFGLVKHYSFKLIKPLNKSTAYII